MNVPVVYRSVEEILEVLNDEQVSTSSDNLNLLLHLLVFAAQTFGACSEIT